MADSRLSITIRDTEHPCAPYQTTSHSFTAQIFHCDGKPLFWKGLNGKRVPLEVPGQAGGRIHGQFDVPPGCYLVRAVATCKNVITDWAWVNVGCDKTVCVDLVPTSVIHCIRRMVAGLALGTIDPPEAGEQKVEQLAPKEVQEAIKALERIADRLPDDLQLPTPPSEEEIRSLAEQEGGGARKKG